MAATVHYDGKEDILNIQLSEGEYWKSVELSNGLVVDVSKKGEIISIEIPSAKQSFGKEWKLIQPIRR